MWSTRVTLLTDRSPAEIERLLAGMTLARLGPEVPGALYGTVASGSFELSPAPSRRGRGELPLVRGALAVGRVEARPDGGSAVHLRVVPRGNHVVAVVLVTLVLVAPTAEALTRAVSSPDPLGAIVTALASLGSLLVLPLLPPIGLALYVRAAGRPLVEVLQAALMARRAPAG